MRNIFIIFSTLILLVIGSSCANFKMHLGETATDWAAEVPPTEAPEHTVFLIGDGGYSLDDGSITPIWLLGEHLKEASENSTCIFLGDNIYPNGLTSKDDIKKRSSGEAQLMIQLNILKDYKGMPIMIPGNHDWKPDGLRGIKREEKFVQNYINRTLREVTEKDDWDDYFLPDDGCGDPEVIEVNDRLVIVVIDTQWWLEDWDKNPGINSDCELKSRFAFMFAFENIVRKNRNKNILIAMHHPLESGGEHGGHFTWKRHLFPLTYVKNNLYVPMPVVGSILPLLRSTIGIPQDIAHAKYREMKRDILRAAKKNGNFIFAAGHEHNLQYIQASRQHFIISGGGSKRSASTMIDGTQFAYGAKGFSKLDFYEDGATWLSFYAIDKENPDGFLAYRHRIIKELPKAVYQEPETFPEMENMKDSISSQIITTNVKKKGFLHNFFLGKHYRNVYIPEYKFPVLDLSTFRGGMTPVKRGGGNQTNSLRLEDTTGHEWVMRAMTKDASRFIPYPFNKIGGTQAIVEDNFLSTHPFAAIVIPTLADAINVYHTNPTIYYIPKQPALEGDNEVYGGELYLVEERPDDDWRDLSSFGNSKKIVSTPDMVDKMIKNGRHLIDQEWTLRTRLFDIVIGDWDRHDDQWRWASFEDEEKNLTYYRPIPRDRDQPFANYDGLAAGIARLTMPFLKQLKKYPKDNAKPKWDNYGARQFDMSFLSQMSWPEWEKQVKKIQEGLTHEVIDAAFKEHWPEPAYSLSAPKVIKKLKERRDNLMTIAKNYYKFRAKAVDVVGTQKDDLFQVNRKSDEETEVKVYRMRSEGNQLIYQRTIYTSETKEIRLFGLEDDDQFEITGKVNNSILIRVIGGVGEDKFTDHSDVGGPGKKTIIYDVEVDKSILDIGSETQNRISNRQAYNTYNRKDFHYEYDFVMPFPLIGYNPDDGLFLGTSITITDYKFKKDPFHASHQIKGSFAFSTKSFDIDYVGDYLDVFGRWDVLLKARFATPQYTNNFFGIGNETKQQIDELDIDYYRVRRLNFLLNPNFKKRFGFSYGTFHFGPRLSCSKVQRTANRFISSDDLRINPEVFDYQWFAGAEMGISFDNIDDQQMPKRGIRFRSGADYNVNLRQTDRDFVRMVADLTFYVSLNSKQSVIFATRVGFQHLEGDFEFFQSATLDGLANLRGFRQDRYYGNTSFYQQNDLRAKLLNSENNGLFPFSLGITAGFDHGRVWADGENSTLWHYSYGGGIWIAPVDFIVINTTLYQSDDDQIFTLGLGYSF